MDVIHTAFSGGECLLDMLARFQPVLRWAVVILPVIQFAFPGGRWSTICFYRFSAESLRVMVSAAMPVPSQLSGAF